MYVEYIDTGTNFSLCCPYTILAHYDELEWAEKVGLSPWLIRVSAGNHTHSCIDIYIYICIFVRCM